MNAEDEEDDEDLANTGFAGAGLALASLGLVGGGASALYARRKHENQG